MSDYESDTTHLSLMEHGAYRLLLDHYYKKQKALPANASLLHRICRAFAPDEQAAVQTVLTEFFVLESDGYHQKRADREIVKVQEISAKRSAAANVRHKGNKDLQAQSPADNGSNPPKVGDANAVQVHSKSSAQKPANAVQVDTQLTTHNSQLTGPQDHNSEGKRSRPAKPRDERTDHPAIKAIFEVRGRYPNKDVWDLVIKTLGETPDVDRMRECWLAWRTKNYAPENLGWLVDWYVNGMSGGSNGTNRRETASERNVRNIKESLAYIDSLPPDGEPPVIESEARLLTPGARR